MSQWDPGWMDNQRAVADQKKAAAANLDAMLLGAYGKQKAAQAAGTYKPTPEWVPQRSPLDLAVRASLGVEEHGAPTSQSVFDEAFSRLTEAERVQANPDEPDALLPRMSQLVEQVEQERKSAAFMQMSSKDQLAEAGVNVNDPEVRRAYGLDRR
jgi:hypothetical protein